MTPDEVDERCEPEEMSARGYCPDEEGHQAEIDALFAHEQESREGSCELDGSCDDSCTPPARADCLIDPEPVEETTAEVVETAPPPTELPATGSEYLLLPLGLGLVAGGMAVHRFITSLTGA